MRIKEGVAALALSVGMVGVTTVAAPTAEAITGCHGPGFRQMNPKGGEFLQRYDLDPFIGKGIARVRVHMTSFYDHCPNRNRPRKIRGMYYESCYTVVDYAVGTNADEHDLRDIYRRGWRRHFKGLLFTHVIYQKAARKRTEPVDTLVDPDGRHNCEIHTEPILKWFYTKDGRITFRYAATAIVTGDANGNTLEARAYHPMTDRSVPFVG
jgi:hypothetical protein